MQAFILGREPELSLAEIVQVLNSRGQQFQLQTWSEQMAIFDMPSQDFFSKLGGSIKVGEVEEYKQSEILEIIEEKIRAAIEPGRRLTFGISVYPVSDKISRKDLFSEQKEIAEFAYQLKQHLKIEKVSARFVTSQQSQLSSVVVKKNHLLEDGGVEVLVGIGENRVYIGTTESVQDFEDFSKRDFGRPARDNYSGMLPPKLARMMINISGVDTDASTTLLDPFCGSGTVLQEGALLGVSKIIGSDISDKAVKDSQTNIDWLKENYEITAKISIDQIDVKDLSSRISENSVDIIAAEPFLGEPIRGKLSKQEIQERNKSLANNYEIALNQFEKVLKEDGRAVIVIPFIDDERVPLPKNMKKNWEIVEPLREIAQIESLRGGFDYQRPGQSLGREIMILRKKK